MILMFYLHRHLTECRVNERVIVVTGSFLCIILDVIIYTNVLTL